MVSTPGKLEKLKIFVETGQNEFRDSFEVLFNPGQLSIQKSAKWSAKPSQEGDTGQTQFTHGEPASLSVELFFDTYEAQSDVRQHTQKVFHLITVEKHGDLHRPPLCELVWGRFNISGDLQCKWVLESLSQRFDMFLADGTPVRATLGCSFKQWRGDQTEARLLNRQSADVAKTYIIQRGDTLSSIAAKLYKDPTQWRAIAEANKIINPRNLEPGRSLVIPRLDAAVRRL